MLQNTRELYANGIAAKDGDVGTLEDFFFDEKSWLIRYAVADTGAWLSGRTVLLCACFLGEIDSARKTLGVNLEREKIQNSPPIDSRITVSRQYEVEYYRYYGLPVYWSSASVTETEPGSIQECDLKFDGKITMPLWRRRRTDRHLQSARAVAGFHIEAIDGVVGRVNGLFLDDRNWSIPALVVDTGNWFSGKQILISAENVDRMNFGESTVYVNLHRADIQNTHEANVARVSAGDHGRHLIYD
jgi:hypothetical protein